MFESTQVEPATTRATLPATQFIPNIRPGDDVDHNELTERDQETKEHGGESSDHRRSPQAYTHKPSVRACRTNAVKGCSRMMFFSGRWAGFVLLRLLGEGIFGAVYLARDNMLDREVAIKLPHAGVAGPPTTAATSLTEAKSAARLRHPAIVTIHDVVQARRRHESSW